MTIDFDSCFRNRIEAMLIKASWVGALRSMLGLRATSQVWNGRAEWYLWIDRAPGVYALSFIDGDTFHLGGRRLHEGFFTIKCYPYRTHSDFANFSADERRLVESDWFDATNTPRFEALAQIPDSLFCIGGFSLVIDPHGSLALMTVESLDELRLHQPCCTLPEGHGPAATTLIRKVSGWTTGALLFDCLVGLYANFLKQPPLFAGATCSPGFESILGADATAACRPSRNNHRRSLSIGFDLPDEAVGGIEALWRDRLEPGEKILTAVRLPATARALRHGRLVRGLALNPVWWEIAGADFTSELNTACGCAHDHCHDAKTTLQVQETDVDAFVAGESGEHRPAGRE